LHERIHDLDPRPQSLKGSGAVPAFSGVIVEWLDNQAHTLGLTQRRGVSRVSGDTERTRLTPRVPRKQSGQY